MVLSHDLLDEVYLFWIVLGTFFLVRVITWYFRKEYLKTHHVNIFYVKRSKKDVNFWVFVILTFILVGVMISAGIYQFNELRNDHSGLVIVLTLMLNSTLGRRWHIAVESHTLVFYQMFRSPIPLSSITEVRKIHVGKIEVLVNDKSKDFTVADSDTDEVVRLIQSQLNTEQRLS